MLEAGMSLVAVNLPSLWLLCTSVIPERVVHSVRSMLSLHSQRSKSSNLGETRKPGSTDSTNPSLPSSSSQLASQVSPYRLRADLEDQKLEAYAMYETGSEAKEQQALKLPKGRIGVEDTIELRREARD